MKDDKDVNGKSKEFIEEDIYDETADEELEDIVSASEPEFSRDSDEELYDVEEDIPPEQDDEPYPEEKTGGKSNTLKVGILGLVVGVFVIAAIAFFFTSGPNEKEQLPLQATSAPVVKSVRVPITITPGDHASTEPGTVKAPEAGSINDAAKDSTAVTENMPSGDTEQTKITEKEEIRPLPAGIKEKYYTVQVAAYKTSDKARALAATFVLKGLDAHWSKAVLDNGEVWYRAFIGHFSNSDDANAFKEKLCADGIVKTCFVRELSTD